MQCEVQVLTPQLQTTDPAVFRTLETAIFEFMNNRRWTSEQFQPSERIQCKLIFTISREISSDRFEANVTFQSSRPVYNSDYNTVVFNHRDNDWEFQYTQFQPLEYNENAWLGNLTSMLAFYAYIMIGLDFDTFSDKGGTPYFLKAQNIVTMGQSVGERGWKSYESLRNRYWLAENLNAAKFANYRSAFYNYHMRGLDKMYDDRKAATEAITQSLEMLDAVNKSNPNSMIMQLYFVAKSEELLSIFEGVPKPDKVNAINILTRLDAANAQKYQRLMR